MDWLLCAAVTLFGAIVRLYRLGEFQLGTHESLHYFHLARFHDLGSLLRDTSVLFYPKLSYVLQFFLAPPSHDLRGYRAPTAFYGIVFVAVSYLLARVFLGKGRSFYAGLLVAFSPVCVVSARTVTPHALFATLALTFLLSLAALARRGHPLAPGSQGQSARTASAPACEPREGGFGSAVFWFFALQGILMLSCYVFGLALFVPFLIVYAWYGPRLGLSLSRWTRGAILATGIVAVIPLTIWLILHQPLGIWPLYLLYLLSLPYAANMIPVLSYVFAYSDAENFQELAFIASQILSHLLIYIITMMVFVRGLRRILKQPFARPVLIVFFIFAVLRVSICSFHSDAMRFSCLWPMLCIVLCMGLNGPGTTGFRTPRRIAEGALWGFFPFVALLGLCSVTVSLDMNKEFGYFDRMTRPLLGSGDRVEVYVSRSGGSRGWQAHRPWNWHVFQIAYYFPDQGALVRTLSPCIWDDAHNDDCRRRYLAEEPRSDGKVFLVLLRAIEDGPVERVTYAGRPVLWRRDMTWRYEHPCRMELLALGPPGDARDVYAQVFEDNDGGVPSSPTPPSDQDATVSLPP